MLAKVKSGVTNHTKIVATLGPACNARGTMRDMLQAGMDVARVNFSHSNAELNIDLLHKVRQVAQDEGKDIAVMQDLQGAKLRVGQLPASGRHLLDGSMVTLQAGLDVADNDVIPIPYRHLARDVSRGDTILLNDGLLEMEVAAVEGNKVLAKVIVGGTLTSFKGWTVPNKTLSVEAFSDKDLDDLSLGLANNVDMVAMSYVRTVKDVVRLKQTITRLISPDSPAPRIIVKIEKHEAVKNFADILEQADGVMVARGDLGLETSVKQVPITQKKIVAECLVAAKPVIVATHMLSSMVLRPRPTRAEASDVANAVIDHTDAVMLSEETAIGKYPVKSIVTMADIIAATEETPLDNLQPEKGSMGISTPLAVAAGAVELARQLQAGAIIIATRSGYSARAVARFRPEIPIIAVTDQVETSRQLNLSWGVYPYLVGKYEEPTAMAQKAVKDTWQKCGLNVAGQVVFVSGLSDNGSGYNPMIKVIKT